MLILALDTSNRAGSVALTEDAALLDSLTGDPAETHGRRLPGEIAVLLERAGRSIRDVGLFAVAAGPGSFTGLRVGIAIIQGLALVNRRPVVAVPTLDALALAAVQTRVREQGPRTVGAWIDAARGEVFAAAYQRQQASRATICVAGKADGLIPVIPATVGQPADILARWDKEFPTEGVWFVGDGAARYRVVLEMVRGSRAQIADATPPLAPIIAKVAAREAAAGRAISPHAIRPIYIRRSDAELARARRDEAGDAA